MLPSTISLNLPRPRLPMIIVSKSPFSAYPTMLEAGSPSPMIVSILTSLFSAICLHLSKILADSALKLARRSLSSFCDSTYTVGGFSMIFIAVILAPVFLQGKLRGQGREESFPIHLLVPISLKACMYTYSISSNIILMQSQVLRQKEHDEDAYDI